MRRLNVLIKPSFVTAKKTVKMALMKEQLAVSFFSFRDLWLFLVSKRIIIYHEFQVYYNSRISTHWKFCCIVYTRSSISAEDIFWNWLIDFSFNYHMLKLVRKCFQMLYFKTGKKFTIIKRIFQLFIWVSVNWGPSFCLKNKYIGLIINLPLIWKLGLTPRQMKCHNRTISGGILFK